jgi:hypothetical protein
MFIYYLPVIIHCLFILSSRKIGFLAAVRRGNHVVDDDAWVAASFAPRQSQQAQPAALSLKIVWPHWFVGL